MTMLTIYFSDREPDISFSNSSTYLNEFLQYFLRDGDVIGWRLER